MKKRVVLGGLGCALALLLSDCAPPPQEPSDAIQQAQVGPGDPNPPPIGPISPNTGYDCGLIRWRCYVRCAEDAGGPWLGVCLRICDWDYADCVSGEGF